MIHASGRAKLIWYFFVPAKLFSKNPLPHTAKMQDPLRK